MMKKTPEYTAGEFRQPISIWRPTSTPNGSGGQDVSWAEHIPVVFCIMEDMSGDEGYGDNSTGRVRTLNKNKFTTWWRDDIAVTDQIRYLGVQYNIRRIDNVLMRNKFLSIEAESGVEQ